MVGTRDEGVAGEGSAAGKRHSAFGGLTSSPLYWPQLGHARWGSRGWPQCAQLESPGLRSFQWVRRFLPRVLE
jgi:hypothetical protein